jgi:Papain family cysteine protease/Domain of unknown function (DUF4384)
MNNLTVKSQNNMKSQATFIRIVTIIIALFTSHLMIAQTDYSKKMGMKFNDGAYRDMTKKPSNVVFRGVLPPAKNLQQYCPEVGDQGESATCVGWSSTYYLRTIMEAKTRKLTNPTSIAPFRFSPTYTYEQIKSPTDKDCSGGATIGDALFILKNKGAVLLSRLPFQCDVDVSKFDAEAAQYKIEGYATLFDPAETANAVKVLKIKEALAETENPVLIGMALPRSFFSATDSWQAAPAESPEVNMGGHAMAIVGYDDNKYGGSFLIINSWSTKWGNAGYTWAKYDDLARFTKYASQVYNTVNPTPAPTAVALKSEMTFKLTDGNADMPVSSIQERGLDVTNDNSTVEMITYKMTTPYNSGTRFKMSMNNSKQSYVYIVASDDVNRVTKLFPYQGDKSQNVSAIVMPGTSVMLPATDRSFTMDTIVGNDYFLVLVSEKELNLDDVTTKIKAATGSFKQRVFSALGSEFIAPANINYQPTQVSFDVKGNPKGTIVPMLVQITHK